MALVVAPDSYPGYVTTALDVLQMANVHVRSRVQQVIPGASRKRSAVSHSIVSLDGKFVRLMDRVVIEAQECLLSSTQQFDAIVVPALIRRSPASFCNELASLADLYSWLRRQHAGGAMLVASYTGVFLLAEAGLLDGHTAAVSVELRAQFRQRYPYVRVDCSRPVIDDQSRVCAAGLGGHMEAVWRIVNRFRSGIIAEQTAHELHLGISDRQTGHESRIPRLTPLIDRARQLIGKNISAPLNLRCIARELSVSERTLFRRFKSATGVTPQRYLQRVRIDSAKSGLELTDDSISTIAACAGYSDRAFFSYVFRQHVGMTPTAYRSQARRHQPDARIRSTRIAI